MISRIRHWLWYIGLQCFAEDTVSASIRYGQDVLKLRVLCKSSSGAGVADRAVARAENNFLSPTHTCAKVSFFAGGSGPPSNTKRLSSPWNPHAKSRFDPFVASTFVQCLHVCLCVC